MTDGNEKTTDQREGTLVSHLVELRGRLLKMGAAVLVVFIVLAPFARKVFTVVATPLIEKLPEGSTMIATQVASPFLTPFKLTLFVAFFVGWMIKREFSADELYGGQEPAIYKVWLFIMRFVAPILLLLVLYSEATK